WRTLTGPAARRDCQESFRRRDHLASSGTRCTDRFRIHRLGSISLRGIMSVTRLNISLERYEIGLSGAIPNRADWSEPAMDRGILEFVALFTGIVLKYGGRIIHGCHPTFMPVILRQARLQAAGRQRRPVTLVMSELWAQNLTQEDVDSMTDIAEVLVTKKVGDK